MLFGAIVLILVGQICIPALQGAAGDAEARVVGPLARPRRTRLSPSRDPSRRLSRSEGLQVDPQQMGLLFQSVQELPVRLRCV